MVAAEKQCMAKIAVAVAVCNFFIVAPCSNLQ